MCICIYHILPVYIYILYIYKCPPTRYPQKTRKCNLIFIVSLKCDAIFKIRNIFYIFHFSYLFFLFVTYPPLFLVLTMRHNFPVFHHLLRLTNNGFYQMYTSFSFVHILTTVAAHSCTHCQLIDRLLINVENIKSNIYTINTRICSNGNLKSRVTFKSSNYTYDINVSFVNKYIGMIESIVMSLFYCIKNFLILR